jgi:hypothetical protein
MRKVIRWLAIGLALLSAVLYLPAAVWGFLFLINWARLLALRGPYFRWGYLSAGFVFLLYSGCGLALVVRAIRKRELSLLAAVAALAICVVGAHILVNFNPTADMSIVVDQLLAHAYRCLTDWDDRHGKFPTNEQELREALAAQPLQQREVFFVRDRAIPYDVRIITNASGPELEAVPPNPGTIVYAVSSDCMEYWLTVSTLRDPIGGPVIPERVFGIYGGRAWVVHRKHNNPGDGFWPSME